MRICYFKRQAIIAYNLWLGRARHGTTENSKLLYGKVYFTNQFYEKKYKII